MKALAGVVAVARGPSLIVTVSCVPAGVRRCGHEGRRRDVRDLGVVRRATVVLVADVVGDDELVAVAVLSLTDRVVAAAVQRDRRKADKVPQVAPVSVASERWTCALATPDPPSAADTETGTWLVNGAVRVADRAGRCVQVGVTLSESTLRARLARE